MDVNNCCPPGWLRIFKAISDIHRQHILFIIKKHKLINASGITEKVNLAQPTISHHLKILSNATLIKSSKRGKNTIYSINEKTIVDCCLGYMKKVSA